MESLNQTIPCGCGRHHGDVEHHHTEACACGQEHHGEEACGCGHDHSHEEGCGSHTHEQEDADEEESRQFDESSGAEKKVYILNNLGCANCAAKMEKKIRELPGVENATITFATKQLRVAGDQLALLLPQIQAICASIESEVTVTEPDTKLAKKKASGSVWKEKRAEILAVGAGAILFAAGMFLKQTYVMTSNIIFVISYVILGGEIVLKAVKNLVKGSLFDENFLMSIATLAAFVIGDFAEAVGVMLFYRVGELFEDIAVERSRSQIMDAVDMRPEVVNVVYGTETKVIPADQAKVGSILLVRPGDRIPLDGIVIDGESRIDTSPVTGEPVPVKAAKGSEVISGCVNTSGVIQIQVQKELKDSMVTRILDSVENAAASKPKLDKFITRFARVYTPVVVLLALGTAIIPSLITGDWNHWVYTAITFLVISCPCALVLSVPLAFFSGIGAGSKKGILFKGGVSLEAMRDIKAVVMDKTGTITKGNFEVQSCVPGPSFTMDQLLATAAACEQNSTHPIGVSIVAAAKERKIVAAVPLQMEELSGRGIRAQIAEQEILCGNQKLMEDFHVDLAKYEAERYGTVVIVAVDGTYAGHLVIADTLKEDAVEAVKAIQRQNIITAMLTGDAAASADAVAKETGIDEVHAQLLPEEKLSELQNIRKNHGAVMFVGDGINDAPVLAGADVGAAMGSGADAAIEAADVVFMTSAMQAIPDALAIAKNTGIIAMQNVVFALIIKALVMILGFMGFANMWMAVFADTGVAMLCVLNAIRILYKK